MSDETIRPIFQMRLGLGPSHEVGWLFPSEGTPDEGEAGSWYAPCFTIAWRPDTSFTNAEYFLPGERKGEYVEFKFRFDGHMFVCHHGSSTIRLAVHDPAAPQDFRGLPFYRVFPYIGSETHVLGHYGESGPFAFLPLMPLDLIEMDRLYLQSQIVFVGVTSTFGPHARRQALSSP